MLKALYPASNTPDALSREHVALKIARHTPCSTCADCPGLHPAPETELFRDDRPPENSLPDLAQYGSDDEDGGVGYLRLCECGHGPQEHGGAGELEKEEYGRRAALALRIDQYLEEQGRLLDFAYSDAELRALR
ncbi:hypothetical protein BC834DRAFT_821105, partial [Gloeopeniophorella convolvens]